MNPLSLAKIILARTSDITVTETFTDDHVLCVKATFDGLPVEF